MLPFLLISNNVEQLMLPIADYLEKCDVSPGKLKLISTNGFQLYLLPAPDNYLFVKDTAAFLVNGFIRHPEFEWDWNGTNDAFSERLLADLAVKSVEEIRGIYTGSYTISYFANNALQVFNTLSGLQPIFYHMADGTVTICSSIICLQHIVKEKLRKAGIIQQALNEWRELYNRKTILENVSRLTCSEWISFTDRGAFSHKIIPFHVNYKNDDAGIMECVKSVWEGYKDIGKQFAGKNLEAAISLSGGVDSRTCANATYKHTKKLAAVNHGGDDFYEFMRARQVAGALNIPIHLAISKGRMFPARKELEKYFLHDGGIVIEYIAIKDVIEKEGLPRIVILGDLFETFKVDGTSIWEGRDNKKKTTLKLMFGGKITLKTVEDAGFENWVQEKADYFMGKLEKDAYLLNDEMTLAYNDPSVKAEIRADFIDWLNDFRHYNLKYIEDLNEVAYWLSKGRTSMWLQSSSCIGETTGYTLYCTDNNLKEILSVPLKHRLRQKLHFYMFRLPEFNKISKIPTPQIPFVNVSAFLPIKELVMFLRLKLDTFFSKAARSNPNKKRKRLLKGPDYRIEYNDDNFEKYASWFDGKCMSKEKMLAYFLDIQNGKLGAFSTMDFIGMAKAEYLTGILGRLQKHSAPHLTARV